MIDKDLYIKNISKIEKKQDGSYIIIKNDMCYHVPNNYGYEEEYNIITNYINKNSIKIDDYIEPNYKIIDSDEAGYIRNKRDMLLQNADTIIIKYQEQVALNIIKENNDYYKALLQYKQNLRDITKQIDFPYNVIFPIMPEYIELDT